MSVRRTATTALVAFLTLIYLIGPSTIAPRSILAQDAHATPTPVDLSQLDAMTAAAVAMIRTATAMEAGAAVLDTESRHRNDPSLAELADHWRTDARDLRDRGIWMLLSQTAGSMVHDPDTAHELDLRSLLANGESMIVEGDSMVEHGKEMAAQVSDLRDSGVLTGQIADQLAETADEMITTGERVSHDGKEMRDYAKRMLQSLGE